MTPTLQDHIDYALQDGIYGNNTFTIEDVRGYLVDWYLKEHKRRFPNAVYIDSNWNDLKSAESCAGSWFYNNQCKPYDTTLRFCNDGGSHLDFHLAQTGNTVSITKHSHDFVYRKPDHSNPRIKEVDCLDMFFWECYFYWRLFITENYSFKLWSHRPYDFVWEYFINQGWVSKSGLILREHPEIHLYHTKTY